MLRFAPLVIGLALLLSGGCFAAVGGGMAAADGPETWFGSGYREVETPAYALVMDVEDVWKHSSPRQPQHDGSSIPVGHADQVAIRAEARDERELFIGVGSEHDVAAFLDDVKAERITGVEFAPLDLNQHTTAGSRPPLEPDDAVQWLARATDGDRVLTWPIRSEPDQVVVMNADGSDGVSARIALSVGMEYSDSIAYGFVGAGLVVAVSGLVCAMMAFRALRRPRD